MSPVDLGDVKFARQIERYVERLDPEMLAATGGDRMPARPLLLVENAEQ